MAFFADFLTAERIETYALCRLSDCRIVNPSLLARSGIGENDNVLLLAVPYATGIPHGNLSAYAVSPDYHRYFKGLFERASAFIQAKYPSARVNGYADHSPIDEVTAAAECGLGVIGEHGLLLTERYSSYVFLGGIFTNLSPEELEIPYAEQRPAGHCPRCGACKRACPVSDAFSDKTKCLSSVTQRKGTLTEDEKEQLRQAKTAWGCDVCQEACPYTKRAKLTPIPYFYENTIPSLTLRSLGEMSEQAFAERAYAWRGRAVIARNLTLLEETK